jgi:DNA-binding MarR family transcriptional regulator
VADLVARGLVERSRDPTDARARLVAHSRRGERAVDAARSSRDAIAREIDELLGSSAASRLLCSLRSLSDEYRAADTMRARRLRPEHAR